MSKIHILLAASLLMAALPAALAAPDADSPLITQLKQIATQGQDPQTTAQVNAYIDQNKGPLNAILQSSAAYLKQAGVSSDPSGDATPSTAPQPATTQPSTAPTTATATASTDPAASQTQPSTGLQTSSPITDAQIQPSSGLQTSHLAGYPALPQGEPISSVTTLSPAQAQFVAKIRQENLARKAELMASASGAAY